MSGEIDAEAVLTVLGSGTLLPDGKRGSAAYHVRSSAHQLLLDAGMGTHHGLAREGLDWRALDTIAISHYHPDHVTDLPALLAAFRFGEVSTPLTLIGPRGFGDYLKRLAALHGSWVLEPSRPLTVVELDETERWSSPDRALTLSARSTPHTDESVAYRLDGVGWSIGYTGDTGPDPYLHAFFAGCSVLVAECSLDDPPPMDSHLSPRSVSALASAAEPRELVISHVYPPLTPETAAARIRQSYSGRVSAARDGLRLRLSEAEVTVDP